MNPLHGQSFFCSWSGGKDSCLSLQRAVAQGGKPRYLLTMMREDGLRSRSHGIPKALLQAQARSLGLPILFRSAGWDDYESVFISALQTLRKKGIETGVFGDIDIEAHRQWVQKVCARADIVPFHPLWKQNRRQLLDSFVDFQFEATIVVVNTEKMSSSFLGKPIIEQTIVALEQAGIDPSGEEGEYHTLVTDGPLFSFPIHFKTVCKIAHEEYHFLEIEEAEG